MAEQEQRSTSSERRLRSANGTSSRSGSGEQESGPKRSGQSRKARRLGSVEAAQAAQRQLAELTGREPEGIVGLERDDDGWTVEVEVLELERIPRTTDVLATYEVTLDQRGELTGYRRSGRYVRGAPGEE